MKTLLIGASLIALTAPAAARQIPAADGASPTETARDSTLDDIVATAQKNSEIRSKASGTVTLVPQERFGKTDLAGMRLAGLWKPSPRLPWRLS